MMEDEAIVVLFSIGKSGFVWKFMIYSSDEVSSFPRIPGDFILSVNWKPLELSNDPIANGPPVL